MVGSGDRSERIRTYNFPQGRLTDHRINLTIYQLDRVMEGEIDEVVEALITHYQAEVLKATGKASRMEDRCNTVNSAVTSPRSAQALLTGARSVLPPAGIEAARLDAEVLLGHVLDMSREQL